MAVASERWARALSASLLLHATAVALATIAGTSVLSARSPVTQRDVWTGDAIDVASVVEPSELPVAAPTPSAGGVVHEHAADPTASSEPTVAVERALGPGAPSRLPRVGGAGPRSLRPRRAAPREDPDAVLARKILEYRPSSGRDGQSAGAEPPEPEGERAEPVRGGGVGALGPARSFARAFTRAIPPATSGDPVWEHLGLGDAGFVLVTVTIDDDGGIAQERVHDTPVQPPEYLERLVRRTLMLLRGGRFVLTSARSGAQTLRVDVTVSERERGPLALGFEAPSVSRPGHAYFQLASGRLVEAKVRIKGDSGG